MRLFRVRFWVVAAGLATACGGHSRGVETGQSGVPGAAGADGAVSVAGGDACSSGKDAYRRKRTEVLARLATSGCTTDADCGALWETNACTSTCGIATTAAGIDAATQELKAFAKDNCSTCPWIPTPPCVPPQPITCVEGQCQGG